MRKKCTLLFAALISFFSFHCNAQQKPKGSFPQFKFGLNAGFNYSQVNLQKSYGLFSQHLSSKINRGNDYLGWNAGIKTELRFSKFWGLTSGLGINRIQSSATRIGVLKTTFIIFGGSETVTLHDTIKQSIYQLEIPLLLTLQTGKGNNGLFLETGIVFIPIRWGNGTYSFSSSDGKHGQVNLNQIANITAVFNMGVRIQAVNKITLGFGWLNLSPATDQRDVWSTVIRLGYTRFL